PRDVKPGDSFMEFAAAHRRSFRGAYADYIDFVTAVTLGAFLGPAADRGALHDAFLENHADDPLCLEVASMTLRATRGDAREHEAASARRLGERLGVRVEVADQAGGE